MFPVIPIVLVEALLSLALFCGKDVGNLLTSSITNPAGEEIPCAYPTNRALVGEYMNILSLNRFALAGLSP